MDAIDVLMEARAYIEKGWCQGHAALDEAGEIAAVDSRTTTAVCLWGAILKAVGRGGFDDAPERRGAESLLGEVVGRHNYIAWNDQLGRTQSEVLEAFDRAIALGIDREMAR